MEDSPTRSRGLQYNMSQWNFSTSHTKSGSIPIKSLHSMSLKPAFVAGDWTTNAPSFSHQQALYAPLTGGEHMGNGTQVLSSGCAVWVPLCAHHRALPTGLAPEGALATSVRVRGHLIHSRRSMNCTLSGPSPTLPDHEHNALDNVGPRIIGTTRHKAQVGAVCALSINRGNVRSFIGTSLKWALVFFMSYCY